MSETKVLNIDELKSLVESSRNSKQDQYELLKYVQNGIDLSDAIGNFIPWKIVDVVEKFSFSKKTLVDGCIVYLKCLVKLESFINLHYPGFLETKPSPLLPIIPHTKNIQAPLSVSDGCSFLEILIEQINEPKLSVCQRIGIINIFSCAMGHGMFDQMITVMNRTVKKHFPTILSGFFPDASAPDALKIDSIFLSLWNYGKDIFVLSNGEEVRLNELIQDGFHNWFYGRLLTAENQLRIKNGEKPIDDSDIVDDTESSADTTTDTDTDGDTESDYDTDTECTDTEDDSECGVGDESN